MKQPPPSVGGTAEIVLHLHLDGVRTTCRTTGTFDSEGVLISTILLHRDIGLSSFFRPKDGEFSDLHITGRIHGEGQKHIFAREHDWRELDSPQRVRECVNEHVDALLAVFEEMDVAAKCEVDPKSLARLQQAVTMCWSYG